MSKDLTIRPILYTFKHIRSFNRENFVKLFKMRPDFKKLDPESLILKAVNYVCRYNTKIDLEMVKKIEKQVLKEQGGAMESCIDKAIQKSREQGMQQVALNMLKKMRILRLSLKLRDCQKKR